MSVRLLAAGVPLDGVRQELQDGTSFALLCVRCAEPFDRHSMDLMELASLVTSFCTFYAGACVCCSLLGVCAGPLPIPLSLGRVRAAHVLRFSVLKPSAMSAIC